MISNLKKALEEARREVAMQTGIHRPAPVKTSQDMPPAVLRDTAEAERFLRA